MAQTHQARHDETDAEARQRIYGSGDISADTAAWLETAKACKFVVRADDVWAHADGMLFPVPALNGFHLLPESVRGMVLRATVQMVSTRVGGNADAGADVANLVALAMSTGKLPDPQVNDAQEAIYRASVRLRLKNAGHDVSAIKMADFDATCDQYRDKLFGPTVAKAIAAGKSKPGEQKETKGRKRSAATVLEIELDDAAN